MSVPGFFVVNVLGTLTRLYLVRRLGEAFEAPIDDVLDFIAEHRTPLLIATVGIFGLDDAQRARAEPEEDLEVARRRHRGGRGARRGAAGQLSGAAGAVQHERSSSTQASGNVSPLQNDSRSKARPSRSPRWNARAKPCETTTPARRRLARRRRRRRPAPDGQLVVGFPPVEGLPAEVPVGHGPVAGTDPGPGRLPQPRSSGRTCTPALGDGLRRRHGLRLRAGHQRADGASPHLGRWSAPTPDPRRRGAIRWVGRPPRRAPSRGGHR